VHGADDPQRRCGQRLGSFAIGSGTNPGTFWLNVPANTIAGTYTSTINVSIASGPNGLG
jgi:hypothetical protein